MVTLANMPLLQACFIATDLDEDLTKHVTQYLKDSLSAQVHVDVLDQYYLPNEPASKQALANIR